LQRHFRVEIRNASRGAVLTLFGELDLASSPALEQELDKVAGSQLVVVDLRELDFIDSTGLSVFVRAHHRAQAGGTEFAVVQGRDGGQVQRLLGLTGLEERLRIGDTPEELLNGS
jgi:anti-anti-sigma factor